MRKKSFVLLSLLVLASLLLTACRGAATPEGPAGRTCADGLEGETITFYSQAGLTGPLSTILGTGFVAGFNDGIAALNEAGGICGADCRFGLGRYAI